MEFWFIVLSLNYLLCASKCLKILKEKSEPYIKDVCVCLVFNANNISAISCWSVLLVGETGVPGENHRPAASHCQTLSHNVVSSTPRHERGFELTTSVIIGIDCRSSGKLSVFIVSFIVCFESHSVLNSLTFDYHVF